MSSNISIIDVAPAGAPVTLYDRGHLALYAALLDAERAGMRWQEAASILMQIDVTVPSAEACWRSHMERARWIVGDGLAAAITTFEGVQASD